ncbi:hypothetical protein TREMEDRAFT_64268 [Tremella mesenterica DSM 1558]|uniref:uncharacterized protein n=1 Tax=Tremella mesenterica (strain ATCC 24925 / CBS 8224 / DSM 1558 / NBRC 9311 / NRRL Y-6157 / RJB 2259-6 / UBC 559-6) TaxID=578456 RepID=UPI0003F49312|nr:uncharacterized protein TREMEDRAFT_64268 [Tremella mesenterica DSM 1558]EIW67673.1 hypothetical protein TREMEDRAFT_64268 [Tremella mesenterica DSM 1558]
MKHGIKLRKLQRTPSHRWALLRNLVTALLHHESIKTTLPKAKETARLAEKIITLGKKSSDPARRAAQGFLFPNHTYSPSAVIEPVPPPRPLGYSSPSTKTPSISTSQGNSDAPIDPEASLDPPPSPHAILSKVFTNLATRYATRPGGYTRIHKFGRRQGDNAPHAILELVDGPRDLKFELTARAVGREMAQASPSVTHEQYDMIGKEDLRERTRMNREKVLKFRDQEGQKNFEARALQWAAQIEAEETAHNGHKRNTTSGLAYDVASRTKNPYVGRSYRAGEKMAGMPVHHTGLGLARGDLTRRLREGREPRFLRELRKIEGS